MMKLRLQVPADREGTAAVTLTHSGRAVAVDEAVASAHPLIAKKLGNADGDPLRVGGHPPLGSYRLLSTQRLEGDQLDEYGGHALLFEPISGKALEAESFGRLGLLVYGGRAGKDGRLRKTQGGVRLTDVLLQRIVSMLTPGMDLGLELVPVKPAAWWAFWRSAVRPHPLSPEPPTHSSAPLDELTLLQTMLAAAPPRRPRPASNEFDRSDDDRWRDRGGSSSSSGEAFRGGGGEFGGGGASGRWDAPGSGVDQAGRIVAGAAAGAAIVGIAAAAAAADAHGESMTDTTAGTSY